MLMLIDPQTCDVQGMSIASGAYTGTYVCLSLMPQSALALCEFVCDVAGPADLQVDPETSSLHVTSMYSKSVVDLKELLSNMLPASFTAQVTKFEVFGKDTDPKVYVVASLDSPGAVQFHQDLKGMLEWTSEHGYNPHVTVMKFRKGEASPEDIADWVQSANNLLQAKPLELTLSMPYVFPMLGK